MWVVLLYVQFVVTRASLWFIVRFIFNLDVNIGLWGACVCACVCMRAHVCVCVILQYAINFKYIKQQQQLKISNFIVMTLKI
jgi:hypothetical protein